jgi:DNA-binding beta-propeller fold protein YncE
MEWRSTPTGNVYVSDPGNDRIEKFTSAGTYVSQWGSQGSANGQFNGPFGLAIGPAGNVYVADYANHRIQSFTSAGA